MPKVLSPILEKHLQVEHPSTRDAQDMLNLDHSPENNYAGNLYLSALYEIKELLKRLEEKENK